MNLKKIDTENALTENEKNLNLEKRNEIYRNEILEFGFLRDYRLAPKGILPKIDTIEFHYNSGTIEFEKIPEKMIEISFVLSDNKIIASTHNMESMKMAYQNCDIVKIINPCTGSTYNLCKDKCKNVLKDKGYMVMSNNVSSPGIFNTMRGSAINVILYRDGYLRIDMLNIDCDTIAFRPSKYYENCFDIIIDDEIKQGDVYFSGVKNGMTFYHPVLVSALKHQAIIGPVDINNGIFYGFTTFIYDPDKYEKQVLIDFSKNRSSNSRDYNLQFFTML